MHRFLIMVLNRLASALNRFRAKLTKGSSDQRIVILTITLLALFVSGVYLVRLQVEKERLRNQAGQNRGPTIVRSPEERQPAIKRIKEFAGPDVQVEYLATDQSIYNLEIIEELYRVGLDMYVMNQATNDVSWFGEMMKETEEEGQAEGPQKEYDYTPQYSQEELEEMARAFIAKYEPELDLETLTANHTHPDNRSFFRWEDTTRQLSDPRQLSPFIQIGYSVGGTILSYTNTLEY